MMDHLCLILLMFAWVIGIYLWGFVLTIVEKITGDK